MSRAAKKRAKRKKKQSSSQVEGKRLAPDAESEELQHVDSKSIDLPKKNESKKKRRKIIDESDPAMELDETDKQGIGLKSPFSASKMTSAPFPSDVLLSEILLLQDCKDELITAELKGMTTTQRATCLFQNMLAPITSEEFYKDYFEKKPLVIKSTLENKTRYSNLLSLEIIKALTQKHTMHYGRDLNVTKYKKGEDGIKRRVTLDKLSEDGGNHADGDDDDERGAVVERSELWSNYEKGCTIRLLCPHKHNDAVQSLLSLLEHEFHCMVGANAYLTPPRSSQGFAPHYDDIDAFCLQLEGSKQWKVYEPTLELPRTSSEDFTTEDLEGMTPVLDVTLEEGDLLYMPRGWIHQACTLRESNQHSLHLTVSTMQQWAWADLLEIAVPEALAAATESESSSSLREGLPQGFMDYMGVQYEETKNDDLPDSLKKNALEEKSASTKLKLRALLREQFRKEAKKRIMEIANTACEMLDASCDEMGKRYLSERQPPALTTAEAMTTANGDETADETPVLPNTMCRLVRPGIGRLVIEDDKAVVYHCSDNSREYQGNPLSPMEFEMDDGPALEQLLTTVEPNWIFVNDLFHDTIEDKIQITQALYDEGIIALKQAEESAE